MTTAARVAARLAIVFGVLGASLCASTQILVAQTKPPAKSKIKQPAKSTAKPVPAAFASLSADSVAKLEAAAAAAPSNAALWYAYGRAMSDVSRPEWRRGFIRNLAGRDLSVAAETSLARAVRLAPDSARYAVALGAHLFGASITNIARAEKMAEQALAKAESLRDSSSISLAADLLGITLWRRYEDLEDRRGNDMDPAIVAPGQNTMLNPDGTAPQTVSFSFLTDNKEFPKWLELNTWPMKPPLGEDSYKRSEALFRRAASADAKNELAIRHAFIPFIDRDRWDEMAAVAQERVSRNPSQAWGWLGLGLAKHRLNQPQEAAAAFDSGMRKLPPAERQRLTQASRVLTARDGKWYANQADSSRSKTDELFWNVGNPSLLIPGNVFYSEFISRVVQAEIRFTNEEQGVLGADTDRGDILVRFGPPGLRASFKFSSDTFPNVVWQYPALKLHFFFKQVPLFGTAQMNAGYRTEIYEQVTHDNPSNWMNLPIMKRKLDSIIVQAARFRGRGDSTDVALFAGFRPGILVEKHPSGSGEITTGLFALGPLGEVRAKSLQSVTSGERDTTRMQTLSWRMSIAAGATALRVDALQKETMRGARWLSDFPIVPEKGFSISDILVADRVSLKSDASASPRWYDYTIDANAGRVFSRKNPLDVLWETYELGAAENGHAYRLSISLDRQDAKGAGAIIAKVIGGVTDAVGLTTRSNNGITIAFDKTAPASPIITETIRMDVSTAPTGRYIVSVVVLDKATGKSVRNSRAITLTY